MRNLTNTKKLIMAMLMISIFGCFQKKEMKNDLPTWLETNFPGQLVVVNNIVNLDPMNLFIKEKNTILADKHDPEVQIKVTWFKKEDGLGLHVEEVQTALDNARKDIKAARMIFEALKKNGLEKFSVGAIEMAAYILIYDEPSSELRKSNLIKILAALDALPDHVQTSIWIECMEPSAYQQEFRDIIPYGYWQRGDSYHDRNKIMSLDFEWSPGLKADILNTGWAISIKSDRSLTYQDEAYRVASTWATKHLPAPFYLEKDQMITIGPDEDDRLGIEFQFPYFPSKPDTTVSGFEESALGYVRVVYQTDQKTFGKFKKIENNE
jgi:hypothetical protein